MPFGVSQAWVVTFAMMLPNTTASQAWLSFYFGAGSFKRSQPISLEAEANVLGRGFFNRTSTIGYAGGLDNNGPVCYTNYAAKGHAEVVEFRIPEGYFVHFVDYLISRLFFNGNRMDGKHRGPNFRATLGLDHDVVDRDKLLQRVRRHHIFIAEGKGNDNDTLGHSRIYVYDLKDYPFHQAELYHQFRKYRPEKRDAIIQNGLNEGWLEDNKSCPWEYHARLIRYWWSISMTAGSLCVLIFAAYRYRRVCGGSVRKLRAAPDGATVQLTGTKV